MAHILRSALGGLAGALGGLGNATNTNTTNTTNPLTTGALGTYTGVRVYNAPNTLGGYQGAASSVAISTSTGGNWFPQQPGTPGWTGNPIDFSKFDKKYIKPDTFMDEDKTELIAENEMLKERLRALGEFNV
jgi:hypothetical protein